MTQLVLPSPLTLTVPQGGSRLPLVELDKTTVKAKRKRAVLPKAEREKADCAYGSFGSHLQFTAWELYHAAKKTELTKTFTQSDADGLALCFAHEHHDRFVWNTQNFRCTNGSGLWLEDFSRAGLAGRIGEAIAYLVMVKQWGFVYWDRIASVWLRSASGQRIEHKQMVQVARYTGTLKEKAFDLQPDFVFEKADQTTSLMEAKGSFVTPETLHPVDKGVLKHGLEQLDAWGSLITPTPASSVVIASYLREASDPAADPSLIVHVDPPPRRRPDIEPVPVPPDQIRRGNYAGWLAQMGFRRSGRALADRREIATESVTLPVLSLNGRRFAISFLGWRLREPHRLMPPWFPFGLLDLPWPHQIEFLRHIGIDGVYVAGIEVSVLEAIGRTLINPADAALMELQPTVDLVADEGRQRPGFYGSVMPDGSLLGIVTSTLLEELRMGEIRL